MNGFWAVLVREIRERRAIPMAALALGLLPIAVGSIPAMTRIGGPDIIADLALVLGLAFPSAVALGLGASVIGRDVAEGRLGFYFSRPISGFGLWAGKMGATLILIFGSALLVSLPAHLMKAETLFFKAASDVDSFRNFFAGGPEGVPSMAGLALLLLVLGTAWAHVAGTMLRSRSGLLPLDLGLLIATLFALALAAWRIVDAGAPEMLRGIILTVLWGTLAAAVVAGAVQVVAGRSDRRRGHLFLSATLWGSLLAVAGVVHICLSWAFAMAPSDFIFDRLTGASVGAAAPRGSYFALTSFNGHRLGYRPVFLVDADSGHFVRGGAAESLWNLVFSQQGHTAAWILGPRPALGVAQLNGPTPRLHKVALAPSRSYDSILALTPDGERVLLQGPSDDVVVETSTGRLVAETRSAHAIEAYFDSSDLVRLHYRLNTTAAGSEIALMEWNLKTGQLRETGRFGNALSIGDRQAGHLLVTTDQGGLDIRNAETGQLERTILPPSTYRVRPGHRWSIQAQFLADGRVAAVVSEMDGDHVRVFPAGGDARVEARISGHRFLLVGESVPGELLVEPWDDAAPGSVSLFVDAATGEVRKREAGLRPAVFTWMRDLRNERAPGSLETRLFLTQDAALIDRDPVTGVRRVVVQGRRSEAE